VVSVEASVVAGGDVAVDDGGVDVVEGASVVAGGGVVLAWAVVGGDATGSVVDSPLSDEQLASSTTAMAAKATIRGEFIGDLLSIWHRRS
jgi:hypothetical protein